MKRRIAIWAGVGFLVASCWVLYTFAASPDHLGIVMREPAVETLLFVTCPVVSQIRDHLPLPFWSVPLINAATFAVIGLIFETLRRKPSPGLAS
jgi:hypothetical protein